MNFLNETGIKGLPIIASFLIAFLLIRLLDKLNKKKYETREADRRTNFESIVILAVVLVVGVLFML